MSSGAITVFFSYSPIDETLRDELANHLAILRLNGDISTWHDRQILAGSEWDQETKDRLNSAQIILLLISASFIASEYCRDILVTRAMERHKAGEACVIPIILRPCLWQLDCFSELQPLPDNKEPVMNWSSRDNAFHNIAEGIKRVANEIQREYQAAQKAKLDQYESAYQEAIQQKYPLNENAQAELNSLQKDLKLSDTEIAPVITRLLEQYKAGRQKLAKYRKELRKCLEQDGINLSPRNQDYLEIFRERLGLTSEEANACMQEELQPYLEKEKEKAKHKEAIDIYTNLFSVTLKHEYPLSETELNRLREWQEDLRLNDEEVQEIEEPLLKAAKQKWQENQRLYEQRFRAIVKQRYPLEQTDVDELKVLQQELGLSDEVVERIEKIVCETAEQQLQENQLAYEQRFRAAVKQRYPLEQTDINELKALQQELSLSDEVAERIEKPIRETAERQWQENQLAYEQRFTTVVKRRYPLEQTDVESLKALQQELGLSDETAKRIEKTIREPAEQQWQKNQRTYEQRFRVAVKQCYPLKQIDVEKLKELQQELGLSDEVVEGIEKPIRQSANKSNLIIKTSKILGFVIVPLSVIGLAIQFCSGRQPGISLSEELENSEFSDELKDEISWGDDYYLLSQEVFGNDNKNPEIRIREANDEILNGSKCNGESYAVAVPVPADGEDPDKAAEMLRGFAQIQDEVNSSCGSNGEGGINGKGLILLIVDDGDDYESQGQEKSQAQKISESILSLENVLAVVGHWTSNVSLVAAEVYKDKLVLITPISITNELDSYKYAFRMNPVTRDDDPATQDGAEALSKYLHDQNIREAYILDARPNKYSDELGDAFEDYFIEKDGSIRNRNTFDNIFEGDELSPSFIDNLEVFNRDEVALVLFPSILGTDKAVRLIDEIGSRSLDLFLVGDMANLYTTDVLDKSAALGMILAMPWHSDDLDSAEFACSAYKYWGARVGHATAMSYNALKAVVEAIKMTESPDRHSVFDTLSSPEFKVEGVSGEFKFSENRVATTKIQLVQVRGPGGKEDLDFPTGRTAGAGEGKTFDFVPLDENYKPLEQRDLTQCNS